MPSGYKKADVQCPFYKYDDGKRRIICEGIIKDSSMIFNFHKKKDYEIQFDVFCCGHFKNCEWQAVLMKKYDEEE